MMFGKVWTNWYAMYMQKCRRREGFYVAPDRGSGNVAR